MMPATAPTANDKSNDSTAGNDGSASIAEETSRSNVEQQLSMGPSNLTNNAKNYEELNIIGTGAYGTVYRARDLTNDNKMVALKKFRVPLTDDGVPMSTIREISLLKNFETFEHPNIVRFYDICQGQVLHHERQLVVFLVFELVEQDLAQYLERCPSPGLGPYRIKDIMFQLLNGVDFLHSNRVVHRDLKPQNILITNQGQVKLADFGLARIYDSEIVLTSVVVTLWYRSPEVLLQSSYATPVDMWSCGCIFAELFKRRALFRGQSEVDQLVKIFEIMGTPAESKWPENVSLFWNSFQQKPGLSLDLIVPEMCSPGKDLLQKMLRFDADNRISASDALRHKYFSEDNMFPIEFKKKSTNPSPSTPTSSATASSSSSNTSTPEGQPEK